MKHTVANGFYKPGKKQLIMRATTKPLKELEIDGQKLRFGKTGNMYVNDPKLAAEIDRKYGKYGSGDVAMGPITLEEPGHRYTFGPSTSYSRAWDEFEKRRKDKRNTENVGEEPEVRDGKDVQRQEPAKRRRRTIPENGRRPHARRKVSSAGRGNRRRNGAQKVRERGISTHGSSRQEAG